MGRCGAFGQVRAWVAVFGVRRDWIEEISWGLERGGSGSQSRCGWVVRAWCESVGQVRMGTSGGASPWSGFGWASLDGGASPWSGVHGAGASSRTSAGCECVNERGYTSS